MNMCFAALPSYFMESAALKDFPDINLNKFKYSKYSTSSLNKHGEFL